MLMKRGQILLLVSDGLEEAKVMALCRQQKHTAPAALAERLLKEASCEDDATVVAIQLLYAKP